jgi:hypothetical protein
LGFFHPLMNFSSWLSNCLFLVHGIL